MTDTLLLYLKCFLVGGLLCAVGQVLIDKTARHFDIDNSILDEDLNKIDE